MKVYSDIASASDRSQVSLLGLLDLSAAFDTVDHSILLNRLQTTHGITGTALTWIASYLSKRTQSVTVNNQHSSFQNLICGVPQGSVLGPLLFVLYTSPVLDIIRQHGLNGHCYADDTQIYIHCNQSSASSASLALLQCIDEVNRWMTFNRLKLNGEKTEFIWCGPRRALQKITTDPLNIDAHAVYPVASVRNLGFYFDAHLSLDTHISRLTRTCFLQLRQLRAIRRCVNSDTMKMLLHAFVVSRLDYCNSLFAGLPSSSINKLQVLQNSAARLYGGLRRSDHVKPVLKHLHWLRIPQRIDYKLCTLVYQAVHGTGPLYLQEMCIPIATDKALSSHRSAGRGDLRIPRTKTTTYGSRPFSVSGPTAWNSLPSHIRSAPSIDTFKKQLKTFLFPLSYPSA